MAKEKLVRYFISQHNRKTVKQSLNNIIQNWGSRFEFYMPNNTINAKTRAKINGILQ